MAESADCRTQELSQQSAIEGFKAGMELSNQMRAVAEEELVMIPNPAPCTLLPSATTCQRVQSRT